MTHDEAAEILNEVKGRLGEHFDHVLILATWDDAENSKMSYAGIGNFYARKGMCQMWMEDTFHDDAAYRLGKVINPPDDQDNWKSEA